MNILADENIPLVAQAFAEFGEVRTLPGRRMRAEDVREAEILLVRSITRVDEELLAGSRVRFVGTATIGFDHVDLAYLARRGIGFARAPGSNATSAAEYVISALLVAAQRRGFRLREKTVGIIGCGNVGSRVLARLRALGVNCLVNDPPLQAEGKGAGFVDLPTLLSADIVSLHVPLIKDGQWPTWRLADQEFFAAMRPDALFINTSRGAVADQPALLAHLARHPRFDAILDVWWNEPRIDRALLERALLGTPHIAGYSVDGKVRGTEMIYQAACAYFSQTPRWRPSLPPPPLRALEFSTEAGMEEAVRMAVFAAYDARRDDAALRLSLDAPDPGPAFDALRKHYPVHREFDTISVRLPEERVELAEQLRGLGFNLGG
jgi:erythronate-4-phosphate dehydrogenase